MEISVEASTQTYRPSSKEMPWFLPEIEFAPDEYVKKVQSNGEIRFKDKEFLVGQSFWGEPVAVRST